MTDAQCTECGAAATAGKNCPRCGAFVDDGVALELAVEPRSPIAPVAAQAEKRTEGATISASAHLRGRWGRSPQVSEAQRSVEGAVIEVDATGAGTHTSTSTSPRTTTSTSTSPRTTTSTGTYAERQRVERMGYWMLTRIPVLVILGWFTVSHLLLGSKWVFIDNVNLAFHEAGHVVFNFDGRTLHFLGGTLLQLLIPLICAGVFWFGNKQRFAAVATLWWFGENFIGIARYMDDAVAQRLPLVGGGIHDWRYLFGKWKVLDKHHDIAQVVHWMGAAIMIATLALLVWWTVSPSERELEAGFVES